MSCQAIRVYVGNLPNDVTEDAIFRKIQKYAEVTSVELKHRNDGSFAFVGLNDSPEKLENCFNKLMSKSWRGHQLKVQQAKESFLHRLAKERKEKESSLAANTESAHSVNNSCYVQPSNIVDFTHDKVVNERDDLHLKGLNFEETSESYCKSNDSLPRKKRALDVEKAAFNKQLKRAEQNGKDLKVNLQTMSNASDHTHNKSLKFNETLESNDSVIPRKGSLKMFSGIKTAFKIDEENPERRENDFKHSHSRLADRLDEEEKVLKKFESYNNVWKDSSSDEEKRPFSTVHTKRNSESNRKKMGTNFEESLVDIPNSNKTKVSIHKLNSSANKKEEAEKRRLKAIKERNEELMKRKQAVKFALTSVDKGKNTKIVFENSDAEDSQKDVHNINSSGKLTLFNEEDEDDGAYKTTDSEYFRIRNQFEGQKGQSLLKLQATYGNDKRFTLDERFIESDREDEEKGLENGEVLDPKGEKEKALEILGDVLGKSIRSKDKAKHMVKPMLRYDPTKPNHVKFEVKKGSENQRKKKDVQKDGSDIPSVENESSVTAYHATPKVTEEKLPVVSKEKFYHVSDSLREALQVKEQKFSLLEMFGNEEGEEEEKPDEEVPFNVKAISQRVEWASEHFHDDSSEEKEIIAASDNRKSLLNENNHGVRQESLFFEENDNRLIEGLKFFMQSNKEFEERFHEQRQDIIAIVRRKLRKNVNRLEQQRTLLGGKKRTKGRRQQMVERVYF